ncbi:DNA alkylation repair protein [Rhodobacter ferrooxidans]|uniref:DNA alkylation repair enzyme n=1 Tax=Rhodobacter ferrooxidans TaxID=371731 RepID=C8RY65_9RHOB|nr:DNA alkylation repair protein [Rhodobacter sp. SW2]EEW26463.1 DNA alkylation repair enzyme [Rhodobacter sp. SW2]
MTPEQAIAALTAQALPGKALEMQAYHKVERPYLGVSNPEIDALVKDWRATLSLPDRLALADGLWRSNIHEARIAAAKLLSQARIRPDDSGAWALICQWLPDFDAWAIADHACIAAQKRLIADPSRLDEVETWTRSENMWQRRAALVATLPFAKLPNPKAAEIAARERILDWAAGYCTDRDWFIQKAVAWWLRDLSKHDANRAAAFLAEHGAYLRAFARKEAAQYLPTP